MESTTARHSRYRSVSRCLNLPSCSPHLLRLSYPVWFRLCRLRLRRHDRIVWDDPSNREVSSNCLPQNPVPIFK
jgi:hypothetical protein